MVDPLRAQIVLPDDPQGRGRVKIRCPAMGEAWECWAEVLRPYPAAPPPTFVEGAVVLIHFEGGDPALPIVLGALSPGASIPGGNLATRVEETELGPGDQIFAAEVHKQLNQIVSAARSPSARRRQHILASLLHDNSAVLFFGPSRTGKTVAAQLVAKQ